MQHPARIEMTHPIPRAVAAALGTLKAESAGLCTGTPYEVCGLQINSQLFNSHRQPSTHIAHQRITRTIVDVIGRALDLQGQPCDSIALKNPSVVEVTAAPLRPIYSTWKLSEAPCLSGAS
jgi:hypothetical protein